MIIIVFFKQFIPLCLKIKLTSSKPSNTQLVVKGKQTTDFSLIAWPSSGFLTQGLIIQRIKILISYDVHQCLSYIHRVKIRHRKHTKSKYKIKIVILLLSWTTVGCFFIASTTTTVRDGQEGRNALNVTTSIRHRFSLIVFSTFVDER